METLVYLLKVGFIYAVLFSIYHLLFRNNTHFQANRIYLLFIVPFSFILPFINSTIKVAPEYQIALPAIEIGSITSQADSFNWSSMLTYFYIAVAMVLLTLLLINLTKTLSTISKIKQGKNPNVQPFSFFSFIHVPNDIEEEDRKAIIIHEEVHSKELHSLDIMIYEISKILLWWNPLIWIGLKAVKSNHEFIADKSASDKVDEYSSVLVAQLLGVNCSVLANNFKSKPLIKKRIMMMKTKKSNRLSIFKYALVLPVVALTFIATAQESAPTPPTPPTAPSAPLAAAAPIAPTAPQNDEDKVYDKVDVKPQFKGGMDALIKFMGDNVKYPEEAKKENIQGKVFVGFVVDTKGNIKDVSLVKSANELLDKEAIRVVKSMPKWKPGEKDGKKVNVRFNLPIVFKL